MTMRSSRERNANLSVNAIFGGPSSAPRYQEASGIWAGLATFLLLAALFLLAVL